MIVSPNSTNVTTYFMMRLTTNGQAATGLAATAFDLQYTRTREDPSTKVDATATPDGANGVWDDNTVVEVDATDSPGLYRVDWPNAAFASGVQEVILAVTVATAFAEPLRVELSGISETARGNFEDQYDGDGIHGDTFPATQSQVSQIGSGGGSANNEFPILSPNGFVITTGTGEVNNEDATRAVGGDVHQISDNAGTIDVYYLHEIGGSFSPNTIVFNGRMNGNNDDIGVYINTNTQASPTWVLRATLEGSNSSINLRRVWPLDNSDQMVGVDAGKVAVRFQGTGLSSATLTIDQIVVEKTTIASLVGYANGRVWVDTVSGTAGTVVNVHGVADKPSLTWADAITIATSKGLTDFHIINGSTIQLSGNSDNFSLFGDNWTLELNDKSVNEAYFQGCHVSGIGTSATEVNYEGCAIATMSVQNGHYDFCSFSGTVTHTLAGDYRYHNCYSDVSGALGPTFAKTAGQTITAQYRGWKGSVNQTGLEVGDTQTIGGEELGTVDLGSPAGAPAIEIRGIYKEVVNTGSASVNLDGAINAADVALILADTAVIGTAGVGLTAVKLTATGLDNITATAPGGVATTFPQMVVQVWRRFFKKSTLTSTTLITYADDDAATETTQTVSDVGGTQTQGKAS